MEDRNTPHTYRTHSHDTSGLERDKSSSAYCISGSSTAQASRHQNEVTVTEIQSATSLSFEVARVFDEAAGMRHEDKGEQQLGALTLVPTMLILVHWGFLERIRAALGLERMHSFSPSRVNPFLERIHATAFRWVPGCEQSDNRKQVPADKCVIPERMNAQRCGRKGMRCDALYVLRGPRPDLRVRGTEISPGVRVGHAARDWYPAWGSRAGLRRRPADADRGRARQIYARLGRDYIGRWATIGGRSRRGYAGDKDGPCRGGPVSDDRAWTSGWDDREANHACDAWETAKPRTIMGRRRLAL
ncbi:hypothetical protein C8R44DRAFT_745657 [Mycena epipterygia]|nr:hypothetical protein C8R44DRAFT_745657 [Mycena epipterygia]